MSAARPCRSRFGASACRTGSFDEEIIVTGNLRVLREFAHRAASTILLALALAASEAGACDLCAIYVATEASQSRTGWNAGVGQQFTRFATSRLDGDEVKDAPDEWMNSSITQFVLGYGFEPWLGAQLNVPFIVRHYRRVVDDDLEHGDESGFGDLTLIAAAVPYRYANIESVVRLSAFGGLKLPSGNSRRLAEEEDEEEDQEGEAREHHGGSGSPGGLVFASHETGEAELPSGIHGHDLALGSGSVDGILGARLFASWRQLFFSGAVQYLLRTEGSFDYQYANDLLWSGGPGGFLATGHDLLGDLYSLRAQAHLSGEAKGEDTAGGEKENDSAITSLYMGPAFGFTWGTRLAFDIAADLPLLQNNSGLQVVPDYRLRGGFSWRF
jgi:hypothetical protein